MFNLKRNAIFIVFSMLFTLAPVNAMNMDLQNNAAPTTFFKKSCKPVISGFKAITNQANSKLTLKSFGLTLMAVIAVMAISPETTQKVMETVATKSFKTLYHVFLGPEGNYAWDDTANAMIPV